MKKLLWLLLVTSACAQVIIGGGRYITGNPGQVGPTLVSIAITPHGTSTLAAGSTLNFTALGTYSDSSTQDVTVGCLWASSNLTVLPIAQGQNPMLATGSKAGSSTVTCAYLGITSNSDVVTVSAPVLQSIQISPAVGNMTTIAVGQTTNFIATGSYSDGSSLDLTASGTWHTSDATKASLGSAGNPQPVTGVAAGTTSITCVSGAVTSNAVTVTVIAVNITTLTVPPGQVGSAYSAPLMASGGTPPYTWAITLGALPPGLNLGASNGVISGTPTTNVGSPFNFSVQATDSGSVTSTAIAFSLVVAPAPPPPLLITTPAPPAGRTTIAYSFTPGASGGVPSYTWSVIPSTGLPPGLTITSTTGKISGTPTTVGTFPFTLQVKDSANTITTQADSIVITSGIAALSITSGVPPNGTTGAAYNFTAMGSGGVTPYVWSISPSNGLPPGLTINASSGLISGTPSVVGSFPFSLILTDNVGTVATPQADTIVVSSGFPTLTITSGPPPNGQTSTAYSFPPSANGGATPYNWSVLAQGLGFVSALQANNTSACGPIGFPSPACYGVTPAFFTSIFDTGAQTPVVSPLPGQMSSVPIQNLLYAGATTQVWGEIQGWFNHAMFGHPEIGMDISNPAQVSAMLQKMSSVGVNVAWIDYYACSVDSCFDDKYAQNVANQLATGAPAGMKMNLLYDQGSFSAICPQGSTNQTSCIVARINADLDNLNSRFFGQSYYTTSGGKPIVTFFITESNWSGTDWTCNATGVWPQVRSHTNAYASGGIKMVFRFGSFDHCQSDGEYAWVQPPVFGAGTVNTSSTTVTWVSGTKFDSAWAGTISISGTNFTISSVGSCGSGSNSCTSITLTASAGTQSGVNYAFQNASQLGWQDITGGSTCSWATGICAGVGYLDTFYASAKVHASQLAIGGIWPSFNWSNALYKTAEKIIQGGCAQLPAKTAAKIAANGYGTGLQLFAVGIDTWNDYGEGTAVEPGIDNCVGPITATLATNTLSWTNAPTDATYFTTSTIDHFRVLYADANNNMFTAVDSLSNATSSQDLTGRIPPGTWTVYVQMVGTALVQNKLSNGVTYNSASGQVLPTGLSIASTTGVISGTPTVVGSWPFTLQVQDSQSTKVTQNDTIAITAGTPTLKITSSALPGGKVSTAYSFTAVATGGTTPYTWSVIPSTGLPNGLNILGSTGVVSGTPTTAGTFVFTLQVKDNSGTLATQAESVVIAPTGTTCGPPSYPCSNTSTTLSLPVPLSPFSTITLKNSFGCDTSLNPSNGTCGILSVDPIVRATDPSTSSGSCSVTFSGGDNDVSWNSNSTLFTYICNNSGTNSIAAFNPATMQVTGVDPVGFGGTLTFTRTNPLVGYRLSQTGTFYKEVWTISSGGVPSHVETQLFTLSAQCPALSAFTPSSTFYGGIDTKDAFFYSGVFTSGQNSDGYGVAIRLSDMKCATYNPLSGTIRDFNGNALTTNVCTVGATTTFVPHSGQMSKDGIWGFVSQAPGTLCNGVAQALYWQIGTGTVNACNVLTQACAGHESFGFHNMVIISNPNFNTRDPANLGSFSTFATIPATLNGTATTSKENHFSTNFVLSDDSQATINASGLNNLGTSNAAFLNEIFAVRKNGTFARFGHSWTSYNDLTYFRDEDGIGVESQDGKFFAYTTNMSNGQANTACALGTDNAGLCRVDVFIVRLD